jgi:hypothetical protein
LSEQALDLHHAVQRIVKHVLPGAPLSGRRWDALLLSGDALLEWGDAPEDQEDVDAWLRALALIIDHRASVSRRASESSDGLVGEQQVNVLQCERAVEWAKLLGSLLSEEAQANVTVVRAPTSQDSVTKSRRYTIDVPPSEAEGPLKKQVMKVPTVVTQRLDYLVRQFQSSGTETALDSVLQTGEAS